jgi:hypothetical protein
MSAFLTPFQTRIGVAFAIASVVVIGFAATTGAAPVAAVTFGTPMATAGFAHDATVGWEFDASTGIQVTAFGYRYDGFLNEGHPVGIFHASGASAGTLAGPIATAPGGSGSPVDGFIWTDLETPFTLAPGTYRIGGYSTFATGQLDAIVMDAGASFATAPEITYVAGVENSFSGSGLTYPASDSLAPLGMFGPNFRFEPVPEPGATSLAALGSLCALRRRAVTAAAPRPFGRRTRPCRQGSSPSLRRIVRTRVGNSRRAHVQVPSRQEQ